MAVNWREHVGLLTSAFGVIAVASRLLAVSHFDYVTASALLQAAGTASVVVGTALTVLPLALSFATCAAATAVLLDGRWAPLSAGAARWVLLLGVATVLGLVPMLLAIPVLAYIGILWIARYRRLRRGRPNPDLALLIHGSAVLRVEFGLLITLLVLTPLLLPGPWMPSERLVLTNGDVMVGYVAGDSLLRDADLAHGRDVAGEAGSGVK